MTAGLKSGMSRAKGDLANDGIKLPSWDTLVQTGLLWRILITLGLLIFYRLGVQVPLPEIDQQVFAQANNILGQGLLGLVDLFAGGALSALSVFALGIGPYITASIMMQLLNEVFPSLKAMQQERGEQGRKEYQQWVRRLAVGLACLQAFALVRYLMSAGAVLPGLISGDDPSWLFMLRSVIILVAGSIFVMWIGELISEFGVGNGGSLLIFAGIAARLPQMVKLTYQAWETGSSPTWGVLTLIGFFLLMIVLIIYIQEGARKLLIVGARNATTSGLLAQRGATAHHLPIKANPAGVLPIIFASAAMFLPIQLLTFVGKGNLSISSGLHDLFLETPWLKPIFSPLVSNTGFADFFAGIGAFIDRLFAYQAWEHSVLFFILIVTFAFFYASILLNPRDIAENLQKSGSAIQGIKPGKPTSEYIETMMSRIVLIGATAIGLITVLPIHLEQFCQVSTLGGLGSTSLIIMVGVAIDLYTQVLAYSQAHEYKVRSLLNF
ncbi:MAG: preprotein translocase subunit SecY [Candidatus Caenarcaniphilales bacterium]|nr:preprotein translocase subunit SecY [Candidatus Caenarcaniphilales bacterium]